MLEDYIRYPIGLQNFKQIRTLDCVYVGKIESRQYTIPYETDRRKIVKVGVNFDSTTRTIGEWEIG